MKETEFVTPLMKQYVNLKSQYPGCILFFRLGDFYEMFMDDAHIGAQVLDITLTARPEGKDGKIPMAGVPYHAVDSYLAKMVKAGYKVAICEQLSEPDKRGLVERDVVRVVTPGTLVDEKALEKKEHNYIISIALDNSYFGIATADLSTGEVQAYQLQYVNLNSSLSDELAKLHPTECILSEENYHDSNLLKILKQQKGLNIYNFANWSNFTSESTGFLKKHFLVKTLVGFGIADQPKAIEAAAALIGYLKETQKDKIPHIKKIISVTSDNFVALDKSTMINLELFSTIREHDPKGSLLSVLDQTKTAMGGRLLRNWLAKPLRKPEDITARYDLIESLLNNSNFSQELQVLLEQVPDIERVISRLSVGIGNARDLINLKQSLLTVLQIKKILASLKTDLADQLGQQISLVKIKKVINDIDQTVIDEPPVSLREGGLIKEGVNKRLDKLRQIVGGGKEWIVALEVKEKQRTGISTLKVRFNKVFGFYIEVSRANATLVPKDYIRKQTLVNGERFITPELKEQEEIILAAETEINDLEYELFQKLLQQTLEYVEEIQQASQAIAVIDCLSSFASLSYKRRFTRPKIIYSGEINIKGGRHPVVEELLEDNQFVPNDVLLNQTDQQLLIITGPNMAGKSVFIRQVAIIILMAQVGCFVPAEKAYISLVDKIFVRSGAADVITSGLSTFMVEMMETANILNHATRDSLIVMDEIGRGTSTYDGISIAWAVAEYLVTHSPNCPKTLFATHYHELQALENQYPKKIRNFHMAVDNSEGDPIFLHTIMPGAASHSFGVAVAKLAGIPEPVVDKALSMLTSLEARELQGKIEPSNNGSDLSGQQIYEKLQTVDLYKMTPLEALNFLAQLQNIVKS